LGLVLIILSTGDFDGTSSIEIKTTVLRIIVKFWFQRGLGPVGSVTSVYSLKPELYAPRGHNPVGAFSFRYRMNMTLKVMRAEVRKENNK